MMPTGLAGWHESRAGPTGDRDDDLLASLHASEEPRGILPQLPKSHGLHKAHRSACATRSLKPCVGLIPTAALLLALIPIVRAATVAANAAP